MAVHEDIAQHVRWEDKFHLLAAVIHHSNDAITVQDFAGNISFWNPAAERIYGYSEAEALDMNIHQIIPEDKRGEMVALNKALRNGEDIRSFETKRITKDGRILDVWLTVTTLTDEAGRPAAVATTERDITKRKHLQEEILDITMREREEIGREMHDSMGQILTGIAVKSKGLELKLKSRSLDESNDAAEICKLANKLITQTRHLAKMLHPVDLEGGGLAAALRTLASNTMNLLKISCHLNCRNAVEIHNPPAAKHLYRIAQQAVTNAVKHGRAKNIRIELASAADSSVLRVKSDGRNFPKTVARKKGLGLKIMKYRAEMIGGSLDVGRGPKGGTVVTCTFPNKRADSNDTNDYGTGRAPDQNRWRKRKGPYRR
ncbi:MAG: PAS domain-containing sensor histidine kinase [Planctomycetota bacterium]|jgi:PAS domain S-box-containing protein